MRVINHFYVPHSILLLSLWCVVSVVLWQPSHHPSGCFTLVVVEERSSHMIVKRFGCTAIHNKALYKCFIHSFNYEHANVFNYQIITLKSQGFFKQLFYVKEVQLPKKFGNTCITCK